MPPSEDIQRYLVGAWRLMTGRRDGIAMLDLSADGFWNSFFAIVVALPALIVGWVGTANELGADPAASASRFSYLLRLALIDLGSWILPLVALAFAAPLAGLRDRFVHYVVATNWASAILSWVMLPAALLRMVTSSGSDLVIVLSLALFALSMALTWRLTNAVIDRGPAMGTAVFAGMFIASVVVLLVLQAAFGIYIPA
ncbi:transporter [Pseudaminobacter sp. NGMCC 1.201702]|uniref:transporter n=1 Tax=Pseudaminobacter sp. NGMCC 1.201702 TaxID=3391825 RepID=UPI0039F0B527